MICPNKYKKLYEDTLEKLDATETSRQACEHQYGLHMQTCELEDNQMVLPFKISEAPEYRPEFIRNTFKLFPNPDEIDWWQMDGKYYPATDEEFLAFLEWDRTNKFVYIKDIRDCDKSAMYLVARFRMLTGRNNLLYTVDWSGAHAYAFFARRNGSAWVEEPQTDQFWTPGEHGFAQPYPLEHVGLVG